MSFNDSFTKEICIRLTEEGDRFISTVSYRITPPRAPQPPVPENGTISNRAGCVDYEYRDVGASSCGPKASARILEI